MMTATVPDITLSHTSFKARRRDGTTRGLSSVLPLIARGFFFFLRSYQKLDRPVGLDYSWGPSSLRFKALFPILEASQGLFCGRKG